MTVNEFAAKSGIGRAGAVASRSAFGSFVASGTAAAGIALGDGRRLVAARAMVRAAVC